MNKWIKKWLNILYIKWALRQCHHICAFCKYKEMCHENMEEVF